MVSLISADDKDTALELRYSVIGHKLMMFATKKGGGGVDKEAGVKKKDDKGKKKRKKGEDDTHLVDQNRAKYKGDYSISYSTSMHCPTYQFKIP